MEKTAKRTDHAQEEDEHNHEDHDDRAGNRACRVVQQLNVGNPGRTCEDAVDLRQLRMGSVQYSEKGRWKRENVHLQRQREGK